MAKRTWFVVEAYDEKGVNFVRVSANEELWKALREAKKIVEEATEDDMGYASVWGVYANTIEEAFDANSYVRIWSSTEDPPVSLPKA